MIAVEKKVEAVVRARCSTAQTLLKALQLLPLEGFSEKQLADKWLEKISENSVILKHGWYSPPPYGMSILVGNPPDYGRLRYKSLRETVNWPSDDIFFSNNSILYPYFSAVERKTLMIGDFVGTFYKGKDPLICNWINTAYKLTLKIAAFIEPGKRVSDIYNYAQDIFKSVGASNNTFSQAAGLASDIGHSIPGFCENWDTAGLSNHEIATLIANSRWFISKDNTRLLGNEFGLTVEPQLIVPGLPMASFHMLVLVANKKKTIVTEFEALFKHFGMRYIM